MQHSKDASENTTPHLLIVDDDLDLCEVLTRYLEAEDFRVSSAHTGCEGSKAGIEGSYELIVLDVMLPDKKGFDVLREIRQRASLVIYGLLFTAVAALIARQENLAEIQPLRFLHLLYVMMFLFAGGLIGKFFVKKSPWRWALLFAPLCAGMAHAQDRLTPSSPHFELPGRESKNIWVQAFKWVRHNTPENAYFALDPRYMALPGEDQHGFRAIAQRSALADAVKDSGAASMFPALASPWTDQLNAQKGWERFQRDDFLRLKKNYGVDWVVIQAPGLPDLPCPYATSQLLVCHVE